MSGLDKNLAKNLLKKFELIKSVAKSAIFANLASLTDLKTLSNIKKIPKQKPFDKRSA